ncbi:MAG: universal stress protein [Nitrospira sp.]|jgi:nucleotide-binding universal stress UspA family protein|nr:MAG: universal stress protein [Nitrospira sp. CG24D]TKB83617.1 MAG: universal stress protein [Nitrospira sp.]
MKLLLAIDGSDQSYEAVRALKYLARAEELHILHILDVPSPAYPMMVPEVAQELYTTIERTMREDGARLLDRIVSLLPMDCGPVTKHMEIGSPADRIVEYAEQHQIELILVGARGLGPIKERLIGSVSHRVLTFSKSAVLILPNFVKSLKQVLLPLQGSQDAERALVFLRQQPFREAITITALTVLPQTRPPWPVDAVAEREMESQALRSAETFINSVAAELKHMGYNTQAKSTLGVPVEAILQEAKAISADLLMMGSRGRHGLSRMVLGSVSHAVLHHAQCPLLVFH